MFQSKTNNLQDATAGPFGGSSAGSNQGDSYKKEEVVIHTMKKDLEDLKKGVFGSEKDIRNIKPEEGVKKEIDLKPAQEIRKMEMPTAAPKVVEKNTQEKPAFSVPKTTQNSEVKQREIPIILRHKEFEEGKRREAPILQSKPATEEIKLTEKPASIPVPTSVANSISGSVEEKKPDNLPVRKSANSVVNFDYLNKKEDRQEEGISEIREINHPSLGKIIVLAIIIAIIALILFGIYYFWATKIDPSQTGLSDQKAEIKIEKEVVDTPIFSEDKPNYFVLDANGADAVGIKNKLRDYADKINQYKMTSPVEFVVVDENNAPVSFADFAKKIDLAFGSEIFSQLGDDFSLFIYLDKDKLGMGIAISTKNDNQLKVALSQNEKNLARQLKPLMLEEVEVLRDALFQSSEYDGKNIRYSNIKSPEELSIDYTIYNQKLFIGTTKMTLRSILDYVQQETE